MTQSNNELLTVAKRLALSAENWADLSNALFHPESGLVSKAYPSKKDREKFVKSKDYRAIRSLIDSVADKTGFVKGATPSEKSGRFVLRLPKSLHSALENEANDEGVSLNQLVVTKVAVQMSQLASGNRPEMSAIAQAYLEVRNGFSIDRVVADPEMNQNFLRRCRELGLTGSGFELNWFLFNGRKAKAFSNLPKTKNYTVSKKDEFEFSSEIAIRYIQDIVWQRESTKVSLDKIICNPDLAAEFDRIAQQIAPGFKPLDYRWVALGVRKASGRYASKAASTEIPSFDLLGSTRDIKPSRLPSDQGLYIFRCADEPLFVGGTDNLKARIERHFDTGGRDAVPDWLYEAGKNKISLGIVPMPSVRATVRKISEIGAIHRLLPRFNYVGNQVA